MGIHVAGGAARVRGALALRVRAVGIALAFVLLVGGFWLVHRYGRRAARDPSEGGEEG